MLCTNSFTIKHIGLVNVPHLFCDWNYSTTWDNWIWKKVDPAGKITWSFVSFFVYTSTKIAFKTFFLCSLFYNPWYSWQELYKVYFLLNLCRRDLKTFECFRRTSLGCPGLKGIRDFWSRRACVHHTWCRTKQSWPLFSPTFFSLFLFSSMLSTFHPLRWCSGI